MKKIILLTTAIIAFSCSRAQRSLTPVDAGSKVHFVIKNFSIKTGGDFSGLKGLIKFDPDHFATSSFDVSVDAKTVDTDNGSRDNHLRKEEYFDAEKYPTINFKSTKVTRSSKAGRFFVFGNLTIKGVTKPIQFPFGVQPKDGGYVFDGEFQVNRRDFGVGGSSISLADKLTVSLWVLAK
jgi:polyisoprenoid-binding protein YceI